MAELVERLIREFQERFDQDPVIIRSPGRVNLIGEHTDYNDGFVLPAAVNKAIYFALSPRSDMKCRFYSLDMEDAFTCEANREEYEASGKGWMDYFLGILTQVKTAGYRVGGINCVFGGDIPIGAGMSSSAAMEGGLIFGLNTLYDLEIPPLEMVKMGQRAENEFVGVQCGIMDQFANIFGRNGHVFKLDCRSLDYEYYPFQREDLRVVLFDTRVRRELASSEYNVRRSQCEEGVEILSQYDDAIRALRDVSPDLLQRHRNELGPVVYQRCEYVIRENLRVTEACRALENDDYVRFGKLMYQSHQGLSGKYEVSSPELDTLVELTAELDGVLGARMMGAGFGGCTINLVKESHLTMVIEAIKDGYTQQFSQEPLVYVSQITGGTGLISNGEETP